VIDGIVMVALFGSVITCYVTLSKRCKSTEDCVEGRMSEFSKCLTDFKVEVVQRLTAVEQQLKNEK